MNVAHWYATVTMSLEQLFIVYIAMANDGRDFPSETGETGG